MKEFFNTIEEEADRSPSAIALASMGRYFSYKAFVSNIKNAVTAARTNRIMPGQLVVPLVANPDAKLMIALALMKLGCRVGYVPDLSLYEASGVPVDAILSDARSAANINRSVIPISQKWFEGDAPAEAGANSSDGQMGSLIFSSSGSTGRPKLIEFREDAIQHRVHLRHSLFLLSQRPTLLSAFSANSSERIWTSIAALAKAGTALRSVDLSASNIIDTIQLFCPDYLTTPPSILRHIIRRLKERPAVLRRVISLRTTGSFCSPDLQNAAMETISERFISTYGSNETSWIALGTASELQQTKGSAGRILDDVEVRAFSDDGKPLPPGKNGIIRVKKAANALGSYVDKNLADGGPINDGWFETGDLGSVDTENNLIISGRLNNIINTGGDKVAPEVLEELIQLLDRVVDVGVAGIDVPEGFQKIGVAVVGPTSITAEQINAYLVRRGQGALVSEVRTISAVPRTENGKIARPALKKLFVER